MKIVCPHCAVKGTLADSLIHKNVRCPRCKQIFRAEVDVEFMPVEEAPPPQAEQTAPPPQVTPPRPAGQRPERVIVSPDAQLNSQPLDKIPEAGASVETGGPDSDEESAAVGLSVSPQNQTPAPSAQPQTAPPPDLTEEQVRTDLDTLFERRPVCSVCGRQVGDDENFSLGRDGILCPACRVAAESADTPVQPAEAKPAIDWGAASDLSDWRRENELREMALGNKKRTANHSAGFTISSILRETWEKLKGVKRDVWGAVAIAILLNLILGVVIHFLPAAKTTAGLIGVTIVGVFAFFLNSLLLSGLGYLGLCQARGEEGGWDTVFVCFTPINLVKLLMLFVMQLIVIALGLLFLVVPGIYLMVTLSFSPLLVLDKGMWPWEAMLDSRRVSHANCVNIFLIYLIAKIMFYAAGILFLVGLFWMLPFVFILYGIMYRRLFDGA
jgi:phage FluMu protein Com